MKLFVLFIDGLPFNLPKGYMPPVVRANRELFPLKTVFGFSEAIRATIFSGTFPDTHKRWGFFVYDPENSPFAPLGSLKFIDYLPSSFVRRGTKFVVSKTICKAMASERGYDELITKNLSYGEIHLFDFVPKYDIDRPNVLGEIPMLFDVLRGEGLSFSYLSWPKLGKRALKLLEKNIQEKDVIVLYLDHIDAASHRAGMFTKKYLRSIEKVEEIAEKAMKIAGESWKEWTSLVFSDHGMKPVNLYLKPRALLGNTVAGRRGEYLALIGGTSIRFWYATERARKEVREKLGEKPYGHFLSKKDLREMRIDFKDRRYFDDIYLLDPGNLIFPNHFAWLKHKAMHGYDPNDPSQFGILSLSSENFDLKTSAHPTVADLTPTMLDLLGLRIPKSCEGRSLLR